MCISPITEQFWSTILNPQNLLQYFTQDFATFGSVPVQTSHLRYDLSIANLTIRRTQEQGNEPQNQAQIIQTQAPKHVIETKLRNTSIHVIHSPFRSILQSDMNLGSLELQKNLKQPLLSNQIQEQEGGFMFSSPLNMNKPLQTSEQNIGGTIQGSNTLMQLAGASDKNLGSIKLQKNLKQPLLSNQIQEQEGGFMFSSPLNMNKPLQTSEQNIGGTIQGSNTLMQLAGASDKNLGSIKLQKNLKQPLLSNQIQEQEGGFMFSSPLNMNKPLQTSEQNIGGTIQGSNTLMQLAGASDKNLGSIKLQKNLKQPLLSSNQIQEQQGGFMFSSPFNMNKQKIGGTIQGSNTFRRYMQQVEIQSQEKEPSFFNPKNVAYKNNESWQDAMKYTSGQSMYIQFPQPLFVQYMFMEQDLGHKRENNSEQDEKNEEDEDKNMTVENQILQNFDKNTEIQFRTERKRSLQSEMREMETRKVKTRAEESVIYRRYSNKKDHEF